MKDANVFMSLEGQMHPNKKFTTYLDYNDQSLKEDKGVEEVYDGSAFYGISGHSL